MKQAIVPETVSGRDGKSFPHGAETAMRTGWNGSASESVSGVETRENERILTMNLNDIYGSDDAYRGADVYQPLIARLQEIAARRMNDYRAAADPSALRRMELAGSQGGQLPGREATQAMREWAARQNMGGNARDWMHEGGMMEQRMQMPQPPEQNSPDKTHYIPAGSTPLSRLSDRIEQMGLVSGGSPESRQAMLYAEGSVPGGRRRRVSYDDPGSYLFRTAVDYSDGEDGQG